MFNFYSSVKLAKFVKALKVKANIDKIKMWDLILKSNQTLFPDSDLSHAININRNWKEDLG